MYMHAEGSAQISQHQQCLDYFQRERLSRAGLSDTIVLPFSLKLEIRSEK